MAFSRPVASFTASTPSVSVAGGTLLSIQAHEEPGLENAYLFFLDPAGTDAIQFNLVPDQPCDSGGICAKDGTTLSVVPLTHTILGPATENTPATGAPTITGTAQVGRTLTADISGIEDDDGVANAVFTYQWLADDAEIAGADGSSYTLADADENKDIKARVSFTDDEGNAESLTSEATTAVVSAAGPLAGFTLVDASDQTVVGILTDGTALTLEDPANGSYGIRVDTETGAEIGSVRLELSGAKTVSRTENHAPYSLYGDDNDGLHGEGLPAGAYTLRATAYSESGLSGDDLGTLEVSLTVADSPAEVEENTPATGAPTISGTAQVGETLTAETSGIDDADGLGDAVFSYQWIANDENGDVDISGATGASYDMVADDKGKAIKVRVSFTDGGGNEETLTSEATAAVAAAPTPLTAWFKDETETHRGSTDAFTLRIAFSEPISISFKTLRDHSLEVTGGSATQAKRVDGQSDLWEVTVEPDSNTDVGIVLAADRACDVEGAVCTKEGERLSNRLELTVAFVTEPPTEPPPAPANLTAVVENGNIVLSWSAPSDESVTGYQVLRRRPTEGEETLLVYVGTPAAPPPPTRTPTLRRESGMCTG